MRIASKAESSATLVSARFVLHQIKSIETFSSLPHLHHQPKVLPRVASHERHEAEAQREVDAEALGQLLPSPVHGGFPERGKSKGVFLLFLQLEFDRKREEK